MNPGESSRCLTSIANIAVAPCKFKHFDGISTNDPEFIPAVDGRRMVIVGYCINSAGANADITFVGESNLRIQIATVSRHQTVTCVAGIVESYCHQPIAIEFNEAIAVTGWVTYVELPAHELGEKP